MKRQILCIAAMLMVLVQCHWARADYQSNMVILSNGSFNLEFNEVGSGPADLRISSYEVFNGFEVLLVQGLNGTLIDGMATRFFGFPTADLVINGLPYSGGASVEIRDLIYLIPDDVVIRDIEHVSVETVILTGSHADLIIEGPYEVSVTTSFARDIKVGMDYAARNIDVDHSLFARNIWVKGRFTNLLNVNVGNDLYVYGTYGRDTINIEGISSRNGSSPFPPIKVDLGPNTDFLTLKDCNASFLDVDGGSGTDTIYNQGGNNFSIGRWNTRNVEYFK